MKKIIIVNDNLYLGGIQKSLVNLLNDIHDKYEVTLLLLNKKGELLSALPNDVKVLSAGKIISVLGASKSELSANLFRYVWKGALMVIAKHISKQCAFKFAGILQKKNAKYGTYDIAISFSHPSRGNDLRSCSAEFVLDKINATKKICFVHADYEHASNRCTYTDFIYRRFDKIACCSESVRMHFIGLLPDLEEKTKTVRNFYDLSIIEDIKMDFFEYDEQYINLLSVARLTSEKGISRAIKALYKSERKDIRYYIVGNGPLRNEIEEMVAQFELKKQIFVMGEDNQPHRFMKNADYLLVPSLHEAAPMVFDEAKLMGLSIITTNTTSAEEMVGEIYGIVCGNSTEEITETLYKLRKKMIVPTLSCDNEVQRKQFCSLIEDDEVCDLKRL